MPARWGSIALAALLAVGQLTGCAGDGRDGGAASDPGDRQPSAEPVTLASGGLPPALAASGEEVLAVAGVPFNVEGAVRRSSAVVIQETGRAEELPPLPGDLPFSSVGATSLGAEDFLVVGLPCAPVPIDDDRDCAGFEGEGPIEGRAFVLHDGAWSEVDPPPESFWSGGRGLGGTDGLARFSTGRGSIVSYDPEAATWSEATIDLASLEGTCSTPGGLVVVGRAPTDPSSSPAGGELYQADVVVGRLRGTEVVDVRPLPDTASSGGRVVCATDGSSVVWLPVGAGSSYVVDLATSAPTRLPRLPTTTAAGELLLPTDLVTLRAGRLVVTLPIGATLGAGRVEVATYELRIDAPQAWRETERSAVQAGDGPTSSIVAPIGLVVAHPVVDASGRTEAYTFEVLAD